MTINATSTSFRRHLRPTFNKKVPCKWKCLSPFFYFFFLSFWPGCDRYVENDDECRNRTITNVMENVADFLQFRLAVSAI